MTTSGAITERVNKSVAIKGSIFQGIPGTGRIHLFGGI